MIDLKLQLPQNFLKSETRWNYEVSEEMKEIWAVQLDLLVEFDRVCKKHNIPYCASAGTLLGAIRHQGFIPWDDDIDLMMLRSDYDKLCALAADEFEGDYFWQTEYTDKGSLRGHAQLRNSRTTAILKSEEGRCRFNQGIFIDIFPYDAVVDDKALYEAQVLEAEKERRKYRRLANWTDNYSSKLFSFPKRLIYPFLHFIFSYIVKIDYDKYYRNFESICSRYNEQETEKISCLGFDFDSVHFQTRSDFEELIQVPFEFLEIPVPKEYDHVLRERFGDYHKIVRGGSYHGGVLFDTNRSYKEYLK